MNRFALFGVATAVLAASAPAVAQDDAEAERAFSRAARSFNACLASAATAGGAVVLDDRCLAQESAYRVSGVRLHVARGLSEVDAASATEADIAAGRRIFGAAQARQLASAR
ncbi:hypothetical protein N0B51_13310 [Tsuneonella sp. YG55]|uniref:UrcA family protein n=1 Tax=Tsuneonella litorea TaxID=2976475 RepID=A0A9X2W2U3_9SPHN|nr:hypothetical protein [Tsuneonella litorea]MCT2559955.1 hypothetical protein [Tsuneonella litorea]